MNIDTNDSKLLLIDRSLKYLLFAYTLYTRINIAIVIDVTATSTKSTNFYLVDFEIRFNTVIFITHVIIEKVQYGILTNRNLCKTLS